MCARRVDIYMLRMKLLACSTWASRVDIYMTDLTHKTLC